METSASQDENNETAALRQALVDQLKQRGLIRSPRVEEAFRTVPRHVFVPDIALESVYSDIHIVTRQQEGTPISSCSQPAITAVMLELLELQPGQRVLEIGAGTGYAAALMAHIVGETGQVVTLDLDEDIVDDARRHLKVAGIANVQAICADGGLGWGEAAPYDRVMLTVGASDIAPAWREQLRSGGRLVLPLQFTSFLSELAVPSDQFLLALDRNGTCLESVAIYCCGFIPLRGAFAWVPISSVALGAEAGLSAIIIGELDTHRAFMALSDAYQDEPAGVRTTFAELAGLRLWLALRESRYCELSVKGQIAKASAVPPLLRRTDDFVATIGLYEQSTWCLLMLEEDTSAAINAKRPFTLTIRRFGPDVALAQHLRAQITAWERAGRPFVWNAQGAMEHLRIRACPLETDDVPQAHEFLLKKHWTQFVFTPQMHD